MRAIFFGTPAIAVPALEALTRVADVVGVVCQPDRPAGRGLELKAPPVKERAKALGLPVVQPEKIRTPEFAAWMKEASADVGLVIAYGRILPPAVLEAPRRGCMNLHASLLPRYRGAAPITWAIVRGERETGISLMQMDAGCDTGPVYGQYALPIEASMTADDLAVALGELAGRVVLGDFVRAVLEEIEATPQDDSAATMAPILKKEDGRIDWRKSASEVHDHIRGMTSWPSAFTKSDGKVLKVLGSRVRDRDGFSAAAGTVMATDKAAITVACGSGSIDITRGQIEGRKALGAGELVAGRAVRLGSVLGA